MIFFTRDRVKKLLRSKYFVLALPVIILLLLSLVNVQTKRDYNLPHADEKYIRRVFEASTVGQTINSDYPSNSIDILISGISLNKKLLTLEDANGNEIGRRYVITQAKPRWFRIFFNKQIPEGKHTFVFKTTNDIGKKSAILVHYQPDSRRYDRGNMVVSGNDSYGDLAFRLNQTLPFWKAVLAWGRINNQTLKENTLIIILGIIFPAALFLAQFFKSRKQFIIFFALFALFILTIILRQPLTNLIEGLFGGDAFNYLSKTEALLHLEDFFATDPRKGPLLAILAIPGFFTADPLLWSRWIGILASAATVIVTVFIGRRFLLPWSVSLAAGLFLSVNQDFIWEAPNGMANSLFALFVSASLLLYFNANNFRRQLILAIVLGLTFLTRYEGILVAIILLPALFLREKLLWKKILIVLGTTAAICALPQISYLWSGHPGIRTLSDLQNDGGISIASSKEIFLQNYNMMKYFLWNTWLFSEKIGYPLYGITLGFLAGLILIRRESKIKTGLWNIALIGIPGLVVVLTLVLSISTQSRLYSASLPLFFCGFAVPFIFYKRSGDATVLMLVFLSQLFFITIVIPKSRYYLQIIPILSFLLAAGIYFFWKQKNNLLTGLFSASVIGLLTGFFVINGHNSQELRLEKYNSRAFDTSVMIQAVKHLRSQHGIIGFRTNEEQSIQIFIPRERRKFFSPKDGASVATQEIDWIKENDIKYLVERNRPENWVITQLYPNIFEHMHTYDSIYGDSRVMIYTVHRDKLDQINQPSTQ